MKCTMHLKKCFVLFFKEMFLYTSFKLPDFAFTPNEITDI